MKRTVKSTINKELAGVTVRILQDSVWSNSPTLKLVRKHGGKVCFTDSPKVTHLVTIDTPIRPYQPNDGTLTQEAFLDYVKARTNADAVGAVTLSIGQFRDMLQGMVNAARAREEQETSSRLYSTAMPGFVGL